MEVKRGEIVWANLQPVRGKEQGGVRPVLIVQNDVFNFYSPTTIIAPITSKIPSKKYLTSIVVFKEDSKLKNDSTILTNQIRAIDKSRIIKKISSLNLDIMKRVDGAIKISLGLSENQ